MKVTTIPIVIGAFGTVTKGLLKGVEDLDVGGRVETIKRQHYSKRPEYWEESWRLEETWCHSNSSERPSAYADVINSNNNNQQKRELAKIVEFAAPADFGIPLEEREKKDKYLDLASELIKTIEHEGDNYTNRDSCFRYSK